MESEINDPVSGEIISSNAKFPVWKTIEIGTCKTFHDIKRKLSKYHLSNWVRDILEKPDFRLAKEKKEVRLCLVSVRELTGKSMATRKEIYRSISGVGKFCDPEVGPLLRTVYRDQPTEDWIYVAMEPIKDSCGRPNIFSIVSVKSRLWLRVDWAYSTHVFNGEDKFLFQSHT